MLKAVIFAAVMIVSVASATGSASAQAAPAGVEKKNYNYSEWTKGRFSEVVTVTGPGKMVFLAGVGAEDENGAPGTILHKGDFGAQCKYAYDKIKRLLDKHGASLADVAKMVSYLTDVRYQPDYGKCRSEAFGSQPPPAHTLLTISQLAWPGMIVEVDVTASYRNEFHGANCVCQPLPPPPTPPHKGEGSTPSARDLFCVSSMGCVLAASTTSTPVCP
jgi:2-iminobutanoate/2-iminopropanoate deaminase